MALSFKDKLKLKMDDFVHEIFRVTRFFPKSELFITVPQIKRSALSIILNYIEGYARIKKGNQLNFLEISYGSLKETKYLLYFSMKEGFLNLDDHDKLAKKIDEIGAMLWTEITALNKSLNN